MSNPRPKALVDYWNRVAALGCVICKGPAVIAHAHNGSVRERMQECKAKGRKLPRYDWIVLGLCHPHHLLLDADVLGWESIFGDQAMWIDRISKQLGVDVWTLAQVGRKTVRRAA